MGESLTNEAPRPGVEDRVGQLCPRGSPGWFQRRVQDGSDQAWEEILDCDRHFLIRVAWGIVPGSHEDAAQEAEMRIWRNRRKIVDYCKYRNAVIRNACFDVLRRTKRRPECREADLFEDMDLEKLAARDIDMANSEYERSEAIFELHACVAQLTPQDRLVVEGKLKGLTAEEIGRLANMSPGTVDTRYSRAVKALGECLNRRAGR
jgi:RNA polymerase sigma factor (sigma-70 family)